MTGKILLIDNDEAFTKQLSNDLLLEKYESCITENAETALKLALNQSFDAIILELRLPNKNGFEFLQAFREHKQTPVLFLSACKTEIDRLMGIELGGDDYLTKPYDLHDLLARLRAILRRTQQTISVSRPKIQLGNIMLDCAQHQVTLNNTLLELTNTEFKLLEILIRSPGQAFSKEELTEYALNRKFTAYDRSVDVHISNLRQKLGHHADANHEPWIKTVRGFGYLLNHLPHTEEICT
jgi:two-component system, OmpR family, response regulator CpxR